MRALRVLVRIRVAEVFRRPLAAFWFFGLPLILLAMFALGFRHGHPFERRHVAVVGDPVRVEAALADAIHVGGIAVDVVDDDERGRARLESRTASAMVIGGRVIVGPREELFGRGLAETLGARLEVVPLAESGYVQYLVPGILAQSVVLAGLFGMGYAMVRYRESRFLRKLATTRLSRTEFVLAQLAARLLLVAIELVLVLAVVGLTLDIPLSVASIGWVLAVGLAGLVSFMGIGFVISCLVTDESVVADVINAVSVPIALLSEIFFSTEELPRAIAWISSALPSTQMVRAMRAALLHSDDLTGTLVPAFLILAGWGIATFAVAVRAFKWR